MTKPLDYDKADKLAKGFTDYAKTLGDADRVRLAAQCLGLANALQQMAVISQEDMQAAKETTQLFQEVDDDDTMDPGYHLHNLLDDLANEFDELATAMEEQAAESAMDAARASALAKLTDTEKAALGVA